MYKTKFGILLALVFTFLFAYSVSAKNSESQIKSANQSFNVAQNKISPAQFEDKKSSFLDANNGVLSRVLPNGEQVTYKWKKGLNNKWTPQSIKFGDGLTIPCNLTGDSGSCDLAAEFAMAAALSCATGDYVGCGIFSALAVHYGIKCTNGHYAIEEFESIIEPKNKLKLKTTLKNLSTYSELHSAT